MKRSDGVYCDRCHLVIAPKAPDHLSYGKTDYHAACYLAYRKTTEPRQRIQFDEFRAVLVILAILFALACLSPNDADAAEVKKGDEWVKGALVLGVSNAGNCVFAPFVMVGQADDDPDTGDGQILGYEPGDVRTDREGHIIWQRAAEAQFVKLGGLKSVKGRVCKAPPYVE